MAGSRARTRSKGWRKTRAKERATRIRRGGLSSNCKRWGYKDASEWHGKGKQVNRVRDKAGTVSLGSSSSTLVATDVDTKGSWDSSSLRVEYAEENLLGMVVGFVAIEQFSVDFVTSVHVCPKSYATYATLSLKVWGMQEVVYNETNLHGEVFTVKVFAVVCEGRRRQLQSMI